MICEKLAFKILLCCILMFFNFQIMAQKDTIYMNNGQILIGNIENASLGAVTIDDIDLKLQNIKLFKIKRIVTFRRFRIETVHKQILYGILKPSSEVNHTEIELDNNRRMTIALPEINILVSLEKNFFKRLTGNFSLGFSYAKSSSLGQVTISSTVKYATPLFETQLSLSSISSIDSSTFSRDRENLSLFSNYNLSPSWFLAGLVQYQRNIELSIARRFQELGGAGKKLFVKEHWQLLGITGFAVNQEKSIDEGSSTTVQLEIPAMLRFNFFKFRHPDIQITTNQTLYFSLTDKGRVRFDGNTSFSWQLIRNFYLDISPYTNYDSKPPAGSSNFDYGVVFSVSYRF